MSWKNAPAIDALKASVLAAYPDKLRGSDYVGTIGDTRHAATKSDHNPDGEGLVCAIDVGFGDRDLAYAYIRALMAARDPRLEYVIYNHQMWRTYPKAGTTPFQAAPYTGFSPHEHHVHVSVKHGAPAHDGRGWTVAGAAPVPAKAQAAAESRPAGPGSTLSTGSTGVPVKGLQAGMAKLFPRYAGQLKADGIYGDATKRAVAEFQRRSGLKADGVVGPATRAKLAASGIRF